MQSNLFKVVLVIVFTLSYVSAMQITPHNKNNVEFSHEIMQGLAGLIDITLEGKIDHDDMNSNKLGAFVNIAGRAFPILESMGITEKSLEFTEKSCYDLGWVSGCGGFTFEFYIGWHVTNGTAKDYEFLNVTYVPYVSGVGSIFASAETWVFKFQTNLGSRFVDIKVPISTQLNFAKDIEYCYDGNAEIYDPTALFTFEATVKSCRADMADNIYNPSRFDYDCAYGSPIILPLVNITNPDVLYYNLLTKNCITLLNR